MKAEEVEITNQVATNTKRGTVPDVVDTESISTQVGDKLEVSGENSKEKISTLAVSKVEIGYAEA